MQAVSSVSAFGTPSGPPPSCVALSLFFLCVYSSRVVGTHEPLLAPENGLEKRGERAAGALLPTLPAVSSLLRTSLVDVEGVLAEGTAHWFLLFQPLA